MSFDPGCTSRLSRTLAIDPIDAQQPVFHPEEHRCGAAAHSDLVVDVRDMQERCHLSLGQTRRFVSAARRSDLSEDLAGGALSCLDRPVKKTLVVDGCVLAGKVDLALRCGSDGTIGRGLSDTHVRVGPFHPGIPRPVVLICQPRVRLACPREDWVDLAEEPVDIPGRRRPMVGTGEDCAAGARARERVEQGRRTLRTQVFSPTSTWIFALNPMPSVSMTRRFSALNPARLRSTSRKVLNGSARTTWSATTSVVTPPTSKVSVCERSPCSRSATRRWPSSMAG